jgi:MMP 1-O-methyltransferase
MKSPDTTLLVEAPEIKRSSTKLPPGIEKLASRTKGFLDPEEGRALYRFARSVKDLGPCLEIGSYCGKSALYLGSACRETDNVLFSVDHHRGSEEQQPGQEYFDPQLFDPRTFRMDTFPAFQQTLESGGLINTVIPLACSSELASRRWATPLGLVFIDGAHDDASVTADYNAWWSHIRSGGYLLIHDIFKHPNEGGQAPYGVYRRAVTSRRFQECDMVKSLGVLGRL